MKKTNLLRIYEVSWKTESGRIHKQLRVNIPKDIGFKAGDVVILRKAEFI